MLYISLLFNKGYSSSSSRRKTLRICWEVAPVRLWFSIYWMTASIYTVRRCAGWDPPMLGGWLCWSFRRRKIHLSSSRTVTASKGQSQRLLDIWRKIHPSALKTLLRSHIRIAFCSTPFLLARVLLFTITYPCTMAWELTAVRRASSEEYDYEQDGGSKSMAGGWGSESMAGDWGSMIWWWKCRVVFDDEEVEDWMKFANETCWEKVFQPIGNGWLSKI